MKNIIILFLFVISVLSCTTTDIAAPVEYGPALSDTAEVQQGDEKSPVAVKTKPLLCILPFQKSDDTIAAVLSSAAYNSIELNIRITGKYDLSEYRPEYFNAKNSYSTEAIKIFSFENEIDNTVYGCIEIIDGIYTISYHIYDTASETVKYSDSSVIESVLDIFDASDEISDNLLSRLSDIPITFGSLDIKTDPDKAESYQIFINDVEIDLTGSVLRLVTGSYDFKVINSSTMRTVMSVNIAVMENERTIIEIPSESKADDKQIAAVDEYRTGDKGPAGGIIFYDKGSYSDGWRYLEAWIADEKSSEWKNDHTWTDGTSTKIGTGYINTYKAMKGTEHPAAQIVRSASHGGYKDWFLPSIDELKLMYELRELIGGFTAEQYWSSSEHSGHSGFIHSFRSFNHGPWFKKQTCRVRAIRSF